ncbi:MAG: hypothetical protein ACE5JL_01635 [Dehalococcoidia bacterium]
MAVIGSERKALRIVKGIGQANKVQIGDRMGVSPDYAEYLCRQLVLGGYLTQSAAPSVSRTYRLTPEGETEARKTWDQGQFTGHTSRVPQFYHRGR